MSYPIFTVRQGANQEQNKIARHFGWSYPQVTEDQDPLIYLEPDPPAPNAPLNTSIRLLVERCSAGHDF